MIKQKNDWGRIGDGLVEIWGRDEQVERMKNWR